MQFKTKVAAGAIASVAILGLAVIPGGAPESGFPAQEVKDRQESQANWNRETKASPKKLVHTFRMGDVDALREAAEYAAWCGGYVETWSDGDIIVGGCDQ